VGQVSNIFTILETQPDRHVALALPRQSLGLCIKNLSCRGAGETSPAEANPLYFPGLME
jgi:hypothetical protein